MPPACKMAALINGSISMLSETDTVQAMFCTALEMKEKKKALYEDALKTCPDQVGQETFRILLNAEIEHTQHIGEIAQELKQGKDWVDACKFYPEQENLKKAFHRIAKEQLGAGPVCADDIRALETGMKLEDASVRFFEEQLKIVKDPLARQFLERMINDEREHFTLLADLKFYYSDPQAWFMEKGKARLDGAGGVA
jgi:rubrerythrin